MNRPRRSRCLSTQSLEDVENTFLTQLYVGNTRSIREKDTYQGESVLGAADEEILPFGGYYQHIKYTAQESGDLSSAQPMQSHQLLCQYSIRTIRDVADQCCYQ